MRALTCTESTSADAASSAPLRSRMRPRCGRQLDVLQVLVLGHRLQPLGLAHLQHVGAPAQRAEAAGDAGPPRNRGAACTQRDGAYLSFASLIARCAHRFTTRIDPRIGRHHLELARAPRARRPPGPCACAARASAAGSARRDRGALGLTRDVVADRQHLQPHPDVGQRRERHHRRRQRDQPASASCSAPSDLISRISPPRSFAERARGLRATSSSDGPHRLAREQLHAPAGVQPHLLGDVGRQPGSLARSRKRFFTSPSSSEWNAITTTRPPGLQQRREIGEEALELPELVVDRDAQRLKGARRRILVRARASAPPARPPPPARWSS